MRYLSLFSGIEAASVAWKPLGWKCVGVAEIQPFPNAVLAHHYPDTPNLGSVIDLRDRLLDGEDVHGLLSNPPDIVVGGSPCQAFSIAGSRNSLNDHRGNLTLVYAEIIDAIRPELLVWENVPGVLSTKDNAFGHLLGALAGEDGPLEPSGTKWTHAGVVSGPERNLAWRILDAKYFGVPQRRRRVFLVGCSATSGRDPSEILFERDRLQGYPAPRGKARKDVAPTLSARTQGGGLQPAGLQPAGGLGTDFNLDGGLIHEPVYVIQGAATRENPSSGPDGMGVRENVAYTLEARAEVQAVAFAENSRSELRLEGGDGQRTGALTTGGGKPGQGAPMIAFDCKAGGNTSFSIGDKPGSMRGEGHGGGHLAVAHTLRAEGFDASEDGTGRGIPLWPVAEPVWAVRRLTPVECARLQGFSDNYLNIPYRGKPAADGNQYKALGNSMAVPVMAWIGRKIQQIVHQKGYLPMHHLITTEPENSDIALTDAERQPCEESL